MTGARPAAEPQAPVQRDPPDSTSTGGPDRTAPAGPGVRRALTAAELDRIIATAESADSTYHLLAHTVRAVYDTLLADQGASLNHLPGGQQKINPTDYAIPTTQMETIVAAVTNRAGQWGTATQIAMDLINVLPSSYDDPTVVVPARVLPDHRPSVHELRVSRQATDVIQACTEHVAAPACCYGASSPIHQRAATTWLTALSGLFAMALGAATRIIREDELSLTVTTSGGITYGITFHGDRRRCTHHGCPTMIGDDGTAVTADHDGPVDDHTHQPSYPIGWPQPGEWSIHS